MRIAHTEEMETSLEEVGATVPSALEYVEWLLAVHPRSPLPASGKGKRPTAALVADALLPHGGGAELSTLAKRWQTMRNRCANQLDVELVASLGDRLRLEGDLRSRLLDLAQHWNSSPSNRSYEKARLDGFIRLICRPDQDSSVPLTRAEIATHNREVLARLAPADWLTLELAPMPRSIEVTLADGVRRSMEWDPRGLPGRILILTARAGMGKTSLVRETLDGLSTAFERAPMSDEQAPLPVLLNLPRFFATWDVGSDDVQLYRALAHATSHAGEDARHLLRRTAALRASGTRAAGLFLFIDTTDDPTDDELRKLGDFLLLAQRRGWRVVVTARSGRIGGLDPLPEDALVAALLPPSWSDIQDFIHRATASQPLCASAVDAIIRADRSIAALVRVPLFLRALAQLSLSGRIPHTVNRSSLLLALLREAIGESEPAFGEVVRVLGTAELALGERWRALRQVHDEEVYWRATRDAAASIRREHGHADVCVAVAVEARVLTYQPAPDVRRRVQWRHRLLQATAIAHVLSEFPADDAWPLIQPHLLFDRGWTDIVPLYAGLGGGESFIRRLLDEPNDAFHRLTHLAAECLLEIDPADRTSLEEDVVDRLVASAVAQTSAGSRSAEWLGRLVEHGLPHATESTELLLARPSLPWQTRVRLWRARYERGYDDALDQLVGESASTADGATLRMSAITEIAPHFVAPVVAQLVETRMITPELVASSVAGVPPDDAAGVDVLLTTLRSSRGSLGCRRALGKALAKVPLARPLLSAAVSDTRLPWSVRSGIAVGLLSEGARPNVGMVSLARSPNLRRPSGAYLVSALMEADVDMLDEGIDLLWGSLTYQSRSELATALLRHPDGAERIRDFLQNGPVRSTAEFCALLVANDGWAVDNFVAQVGQCRDGSSEQNSIIVAGLSAGLPEAESAARAAMDALRRDSAGIGRDFAADFAAHVDIDTLEVQFAEDLLSIGGAPVGFALVERAITEVSEPPAWLCGLGQRSLAPEARFGLAVALARWSSRLSDELLTTCYELLDDESAPLWQRAAVATEWIRAGTVSERLLGVVLRMRRREGRERLLEWFLDSDAVTEDQVVRAASALGSPQEMETTKLSSAIYSDVELEVGTHISGYLTREELKQFEEIFDLNDENEAFNFLQNTVPWYADLVHEVVGATVPVDDGSVPVAAEDEVLEAPTNLDHEQIEAWIQGGDELIRSDDIRGVVSEAGALDARALLFLANVRCGDARGRAWRFFLLHRGGRAWLGERHFDRKLADSMLLDALEAGDADLVLDIACASLAISPNPAAAFYASMGAIIADDRAAALYYALCSVELMPADATPQLCRQGLQTIGELETMFGLDDRSIVKAVKEVFRAGA